MPSKLRNFALQALIALAFLGAAVGVASETDLIVAAGPPELEPKSRQGSTQRISVRGKVAGLYPGAEKRMLVRVRNRLHHKVRLVSVRAHNVDADPGCTQDYLEAERFRGRTPIKPYRSVKVRMRVRMSPDSPDACQGARFPVKFRARVTR